MKQVRSRSPAGARVVDAMTANNTAYVQTVTSSWWVCSVSPPLNYVHEAALLRQPRLSSPANMHLESWTISRASLNPRFHLHHETACCNAPAR